MHDLFLIAIGFLVLYAVAANAGLLKIGRKPARGHDAVDATDLRNTNDTGGAKTVGEARYRRRAPGVLTKHERAFASTLEKAARQLLDELGPLRVLAKVNLADLIEPDCPRGSPKSTESKRWWSWWQSINRKHTDFVLVDAEWRPVCVVELDDASHRRASAKKRDAAKDAALSSAGVPVVRVTARDGVESVVETVSLNLRH